MDYLVVGCGLTGAVIARHLAEKNHKVTIWDKRNHIGGNMYDYVDNYGILVHKYGPHIFHTNKKELYDYICRFGEWTDYKLTCMAKINNIFTPTPFNFQTIDDFYDAERAQEIKKRMKELFPNRETVTVVEALKCKDKLVRDYAEFLFENDYSLYTAKQWGVLPQDIDPSILERVPLRISYKTGYFDDKYQVMPKQSYTEFFNNMLNHHNIKIKLGIDALEYIDVSAEGDQLSLYGEKTDVSIVYTGAIDELFNLSEGKLPYRSLHFEWKYENIESKQAAPVVAYPQEKDFTRITEYKKMPMQKVIGTTYAVEYPLSYDKGKEIEPYYPVLTKESKNLYFKYKSKADKLKNFYYAGRLADFKYYNMDAALERALEICKLL